MQDIAAAAGRHEATAGLRVGQPQHVRQFVGQTRDPVEQAARPRPVHGPLKAIVRGERELPVCKQRPVDKPGTSGSAHVRQDALLRPPPHQTGAAQVGLMQHRNFPCTEAAFFPQPDRGGGAC